MPKTRSIVEQLRKAIAQAERAGMTRYQIAKAVKMPQSQIGRIASGENVPRLDTAAKVAAAIGYNLALVRQ